jgi:hypothetical protein
MVVVEDLNLHPLICGIAFQRRADTDAVVGRGIEQELETERKIPVFPLGEQVAAAIGGAQDGAVLDDVPASLPAHQRPPVQGFPVEQGNETGLIGGHRGRRQQQNARKASHGVLL